MITAFEALLLPTCVAVLLGLMLGYGLESLIQMFALLFPTPTVDGVDSRVGAAEVACARPRAGGFSKTTGYDRPAV